MQTLWPQLHTRVLLYMTHRFVHSVTEPAACTEKSGFIYHKGHEFIPLFFHFPANCEACPKPLWNMFKPPLALECQRCQIKCHKEHMDKREDCLKPCAEQFNPQLNTGWEEKRGSAGSWTENVLIFIGDCFRSLQNHQSRFQSRCFASRITLAVSANGG